MRYWSVMGVQTCALPILLYCEHHLSQAASVFERRGEEGGRGMRKMVLAVEQRTGKTNRPFEPAREAETVLEQGRILCSQVGGRCGHVSLGDRERALEFFRGLFVEGHATEVSCFNLTFREAVANGVLGETV